MRRYNSAKKEIRAYIQKLYKEQIPYKEIKARCQAEFGYTPSSGSVHKYGTGKKYNYKNRVAKLAGLTSILKGVEKKAMLYDRIAKIIKKGAV